MAFWNQYKQLHHTPGSYARDFAYHVFSNVPSPSSCPEQNPGEPKHSWGRGKSKKERGRLPSEPPVQQWELQSVDRESWEPAPVACERSLGQPFCREACSRGGGRRGSGFFVPSSLITFVYLKISRILKPLLCPPEKVAVGIS